MLSGSELFLTLLEMGILVALLGEIYLGWRWQNEARLWHEEEMAQWRRENGADREKT